MLLKEIVAKIVKDWDGDLYGTKTQASKSLNISKNTLDNYKNIGLLPFIRRGRKVYFSADVIAKAIRDGIDAEGMRTKLKTA